ncbi:MAG: two-component system sensor histidine kinase NtrB [Acidobacteriota bacterium]
MTSPILSRAAAGDPPSGLSTALIARWLVGLRLVAVSALLIGALVVQTATDEILPIGPLARLAGLSYLLSLLWIGLFVGHISARLHIALQTVGDLAIIGSLIYFTGGLWSYFPFLFLIPVAVASLVFGLRGALTVAGAAFAIYAAMAEAMATHLLPAPSSVPQSTSLASSSLAFQLLVTGAGFVAIALLTSYLAHSLKLAEQRLEGERAATARLLALSVDVLRSVESGVLAADLEGRVIMANSAARRILGDADGLEGRMLAELLPIGGFSWRQVFERMSDEAPQRFEGTVASSGIPLGCTVTTLRDEDAHPVGVVVHFRDLTEAHEAARRERLRERLAAVGEMAAGIAHEIRNPLASISGSAQVLGNLPGLGQKERSLLRIVVHESRRLSGIIEAFLGYARPPAPERGPCDIGRTLDDTLTLFRNSPELGPEHRITTAIRPHTDPVVADEKQLRQAFFNLARNAIQAMPRGGTMRVEARPEGDHYVIRWHDEGVGMQPHQIQEIFQPFKAFRTGGTGLGLSVVYSIVSDHGGDIDVESEPGRGTTFTLRIPLRTA